ncbi:MAG: aspartyl protease family protein [Planctomycetes bacterium]|nr:aspartyl protease family protein [Planctomycetota bacterium]
MRARILFVVAAILAAGLLLAPEARAQGAGAKEKPESDLKRYEVPFEFDGLGFIEAAVNGVEGLRFMVDTGASQTVITETGAKKAGVEGGMQMPVGGVGQAMAKIAFLDRIAFGGYEEKDVMCAVMDLSHLNDKMEKPLDGILGAPVLFKFKSIEVDFHANKMIFTADANTFKKEMSLQDMLLRGLAGRGGGKSGPGGGGNLQDMLKNLMPGANQGETPAETTEPEAAAPPKKDGAAAKEAPAKPAGEAELDSFFDRVFGEEKAPAPSAGKSTGPAPTAGGGQGRFSPVSEQLAAHLALPAGKGLYVDAVAKGSILARAGLKKGDVIRRVGDHEIAGAADLEKALANVGKGTTVTFIRGGEELTKDLK